MENDDEETLEEMTIKNSSVDETESSTKFSRKYEVIGTIMNEKVYTFERPPKYLFFCWFIFCLVFNGVGEYLIVYKLNPL